MRVTERQLRRIIRESLPDIPDIMGAMGGGKFQPRVSSDVLTTPQEFKDLKPGDRLAFNGKKIVVVSVSPMTAEVDYVDEGSSTRKYFDYRYALADDPDEMPEYDVVFLGSGPAPENTRLPRRRR